MRSKQFCSACFVVLAAQPVVFTITKDFFESQSKPENNLFYENKKAKAHTPPPLTLTSGRQRLP